MKVGGRSLRVDRSNVLNGQVVDCSRDSGQGRAAPEVAPKKRARGAVDGANSAPDAALSLEPHVCRHCFGRLVSHALPGGDRRYQCTNCGATEDGGAPSVLCACGITFRKHGRASQPQDAGIRCQPNPAPTPEFPSLYVAAEVKP